MKLIQAGVSSKFVDMIRSMYVEVKAKVKWKNSLSDTISSFSGVKQGEPLSPMMFLFFINDLSQYMLDTNDTDDYVKVQGEPINNLLYADDTVLFAKSEKGLQKLLDKLAEYC